MEISGIVALDQPDVSVSVKGGVGEVVDVLVFVGLNVGVRGLVGEGVGVFDRVGDGVMLGTGVSVPVGSGVSVIVGGGVNVEVNVGKGERAGTAVVAASVEVNTTTCVGVGVLCPPPETRRKPNPMQ